MNLRKQKAFTLVELMAVVAIIGVLMALLLPTIVGAMRHARIAAAKSDLGQLRLALKRFQGDFGDYPPTAVPYCLDHSDDCSLYEHYEDEAAHLRWGDMFDALNTPGECLWYFLCTKFEAGNNDRLDAPIPFVAADLPDKWKFLDKVTAGPYMEWKGKQLADNDEDDIPELLTPFVVKSKDPTTGYWHWQPVTSKVLWGPRRSGSVKMA